MSDKPRGPGVTDPNRDPPPPPAPALVKVRFTIAPPEAAAQAEIKVRDRRVEGETVFQVGVSTRVVVTAPGYQPWDRSFTLEQDTTIRVELQPAPAAPRR